MKFTFNLLSTVKHPRSAGPFPDGYELSGEYDVWADGKQVTVADGKPLTVNLMGINHRNGIAVTDEAITADLVSRAMAEMTAMEAKPKAEPICTKKLMADTEKMKLPMGMK